MILGLAMMIASFSLLVLWETRGREAVLFTPLLAAAEDIRSGEVVLPSHLKTIRVLPENEIEGALRTGEAESIIGLVTTVPIVANQQVSDRFFTEESSDVNPEESVFVIPESWIASMSSAIRPGDIVTLVSVQDEDVLGTHRVAYIKDKSGRTISADGQAAEAMLERMPDANEAIGLEIICTPSEYLELYRTVTEAGGRNLIVYAEGQS